MPLSKPEFSRIAADLVKHVSPGIVLTDARRADNPIVYCNEAFRRLTGYEEDEILDRNCRFLQGPETDPLELQRLREAIAARRACTVVLRNYRKDGSSFWNALSVAPLLGDDGEVAYFAGVQNDITDAKILEEQFQQSQKLESLGQLAAGIAHDFNNVVTVINGYAELMGVAPGAPQGVVDMARIVRKSGERAASMSRHLLGFTRNRPVTPVLMDLNATIKDSAKILGRLAGSSTELEMQLSPDLKPIHADASQIDQVLMNLVVNACDAMPDGGRIVVETSAADDAVVLKVSDTGHGIPPEVRERIFDPFFTTKAVGKGTGLGLSTVKRIVQANHGTIDVESSPAGTTFSMRFPAAGGEVFREQSAGLVSAARGTEILLVLEHDEAVRTVMVRSLRFLGYTVLEAGRASEAEEMLRAHEGPMHLLVADAATPGRSPRELGALLRDVRPEARLLLTSGAPDDRKEWFGADPIPPLLRKPFAPAALATAVRASLGVEAQSPRGGAGGEAPAKELEAKPR